MALIIFLLTWLPIISYYEAIKGIGYGGGAGMCMIAFLPITFTCMLVIVVAISKFLKSLEKGNRYGLYVSAGVMLTVGIYDVFGIFTYLHLLKPSPPYILIYAIPIIYGLFVVWIGIEILIKLEDFVRNYETSFLKSCFWGIFFIVVGGCFSFLSTSVLCHILNFTPLACIAVFIIIAFILYNILHSILQKICLRM
ncbi:MAG: hypothetical protein QMC98_01075 [Candidatus Thermoplasmatota archaeon]|nr:hypothetical protein [Candidatus Thermoplasmatota archaeon]